ncbi:hypothetical protein T484DRAFT_1845247 [Baffinella frigidus]|nr:hypothetical protein T484DRAFT_1845247 [Cryptophyta sp. CCMP2293]
MQPLPLPVPALLVPSLPVPALPVPPRSTETSCAVCFYSKDDGPKLELVETTIVHKFVDEHAVASPFVFEYLQTLCKKKQCLCICDSCESWFRRKHAMICTKRGTGPTPPELKELLHADRLILSVILPGVYKPPEARYVQRYISTIRKNGGRNVFASICPPVVVRTLCENEVCAGDRISLKSIAFATWKTGRQQCVFGNKLFAKNIRHATV